MAAADSNSEAELTPSPGPFLLNAPQSLLATISGESDDYLSPNRGAAISIDAGTHSGFLSQASEKQRNKWNRRWIKLTATGKLLPFKDAASVMQLSKPYDLRIYDRVDTSSSNPFQFTIKSSSKRHLSQTFRAESSEEKKHWVRLINQHHRKFRLRQKHNNSMNIAANNQQLQPMPLSLSMTKVARSNPTSDASQTEASDIDDASRSYRLKDGFLYKRGSRELSSWKRRKCVLYYSGYFKSFSETGRQLHGSYNFGNAIECVADQHHKKRFHVLATARSFEFEAESAKEAHEWIKQIQATISRCYNLSLQREMSLELTEQELHSDDDDEEHEIKIASDRESDDAQISMVDSTDVNTLRLKNQKLQQEKYDLQQKVKELQQKLSQLASNRVDFNDDEREESLSISALSTIEREYSVEPQSLLPVDMELEIECLGIDACQAAKRVITALKQYQDLEQALERNEYEQGIFVQACKERHSWLLEDYVHILDMHNNEKDLEAIMRILITDYHFESCDVHHCRLIMRHYRNRDRERENSSMDEEFVFYRDLMEQIHCLFFHLQDTGLRVKQTDINVERSALDDDSEWFDASFQNMYNAITQKKKSLTNVVGLHHQEHFKKFNIVNQSTSTNKRYIEGTFMDGLYAFIATHKSVSSQTQRAMRWLFEQEEYDTDAVEMDIEYEFDMLCYPLSNIATWSVGWEYHKLVLQYIDSIQLAQSSFHVGYRFYYWGYHATHCDEDETGFEEGQQRFNRHNHGGHSIKELLVRIKYANIKEEMLYNKLCGLTYHQLRKSLQKAEKMSETRKAKRMTASPYYERNIDRDQDYHYNIPVGTRITREHLLSIILYCDWTNLCHEFSKTFRKTSPHQSLASVKKKNHEFANWSRLIRETVEIFGYNAIGEGRGHDPSKWINRLKGPFYCGMNTAMVLPEYDIRLNGPTSTSRCIEVAARFAGDSGIVIKLNNTGSGYINSIAAFACSWLSDYSTEEEYLFCGGFYTLRIENVTKIATRESFQPFIACLFYFDSMVNGSKVNHSRDNRGYGGMQSPKRQNQVGSNGSARQLQQRQKAEARKQKDSKTLLQLIKHYIKPNQFQTHYPQYIVQTFAAYINHKRHIVINLPFIKQNFDKLCHLIMFPAQNMLKRRFFYLFRNVRKIIIFTTESDGSNAHTFDIIALLTHVDFVQFQRNHSEICIHATKSKRYSIATWIEKEYTGSNFRSQFRQYSLSNNYRIFFHQTTKEDTLKIVARHN